MGDEWPHSVPCSVTKANQILALIDASSGIIYSAPTKNCTVATWAAVIRAVRRREEAPSGATPINGRRPSGVAKAMRRSGSSLAGAPDAAEAEAETEDGSEAILGGLAQKIAAVQPKLSVADTAVRAEHCVAFLRLLSVP